jgi:hypothetical protein
VLVESESELCTGGNHTSYIYYLYTPTLFGTSVCGDLLTCILLFIESVFEVPLKKKRKKRSKGLIHCVCFSLLFGVVFCDFFCV